MANPSIAIIGLEGSGKTVFITKLAKDMALLSQDHYLEPVGIQTGTYIEKVWSNLQNGSWPPSTPPGKLFELQWKLHIRRPDQNYDAEIRLIDPAGQDLRQLFSHDSMYSAPEHLKPIVDYVSHASIVLFVLNLKDYIVEPNDSRRIENQMALKSALDQLSGKKVMLLFTQYDQYEPLIQKHGGMDAFCGKYIPYIYSAYIKDKNMPYMCISAVNDIVMKNGPDGKVQGVPAPNFTSRGLEELRKWLVDEVCSLYEQEKRDQEWKRKRQEEEEAQGCIFALIIIGSLIAGGIGWWLGGFGLALCLGGACFCFGSYCLENWPL